VLLLLLLKLGSVPIHSYPHFIRALVRALVIATAGLVTSSDVSVATSTWEEEEEKLCWGEKEERYDG
jgi:hypothetical protein